MQGIIQVFRRKIGPEDIHKKKLGIGRLPQEKALRDLLRHYLSNMEEYQKENARLRVLGHLEPLPRDLRESIRRNRARGHS